MRNLKFKNLVALVSLTCMLGLAACGESASQTNSNQGNGSSDVLRFYAAPQTGSWYPMAVGITELMKKNQPNLKQVSIEPGGGVANIVAINGGLGEIGFSQAMPTVDGIAGNPPFKEKAENIKYVASLFPHITQIVVLKDSGIKSIKDVKGKTINVGQKGLLTEEVARRILESYDMTYDDMGSVQNLSFADSVEQMKDGRIDLMFWTVPLPFSVLTDLSQSKDIKLLSLPNDKIKELTERNQGLVKATIPEGVYKGVDYEVQTIQSPLVVIANKNTSEDLVYEFTKTLYDNLEELKKIDPALESVNPEDLPKDIGAPFHPGAEKFYKEQQLLK
ncbi:TAXI family TRAP transporter solute-binding subunit [Peribacillus butanolivorans]|uniref:TAXI family TRAP transporter solute-binding subunit n=1 Tax=Peribacillus butanolivorans TaxID=421767 RepID=UPI0039FD6D7E